MTIWNRVPKKTIVFILFLVGVYALAGYFGVPELSKKYLPDLASNALGRQVSFQNTAFNPFLFSYSIEGLDIKSEDAKNSFFWADKVSVRLGLPSLVKLAVVISEINIEKPIVNIVREKDGSFNFSDLVMALSQYEMKIPDQKWLKNVGQTIPDFILKNVKISDGEVRFDDKLEDVSHKMANFSFFLPYLSTQPDKRYENAIMDINFVLNSTKANVHVKTTPFAEDLATRILIKTDDINLNHYLAYLPLPNNLKVKTLGVNTDVEVLFRKKVETISLELQGQINLLDLDLTDHLDAPIIGFKQLSLDILQSEVLTGQINLGYVLLTALNINIIRDQAGELNLLNLIETIQTADVVPAGKSEGNAVKAVSTTEDKTKSGYKLKLYSLDAKEATIVFKDLSNATPFETRILPKILRLENVTFGDSVKGAYTIALETDAKEKIDTKGEFSINPVMVKGSLNVSDLLLKKYAPYYDQQVNLEIETGKVSVSADFDILQTPEKTNGVVKVSKLLIDSLVILDRQSKEKMLHMPQIKVTDSLVDIGQSKLNIGSIKIDTGEILLKQYKNGQINLVKAFQTGSNTTKNNQTQRDDQSDIPLENLATTMFGKFFGTVPGTIFGTMSIPWDVTLPLFDLTGFKIHFTDLTQQDPVNISLSNLMIKASDFMTIGDKKGDLSIQTDWNKNGKITLKGKVLPSKRIADFDVKLDKIDIKSLQPYFTEAIKVLVTDGDIHGQGKLTAKMSTQSEPAIWFAGKTSVTQFAAIDKQSAKDFFKAKSIHLAGLDLSVFPIKVTAKEISLTDFYSRIIVSEKGELNLKSLFMTTSTEKKINYNKPANTEGKEKGSIFPQPDTQIIPDITIENVTLQGGDIQFSDYWTQPNFSAGMKELAGSIIGLSSDDNTRAKIHLKGIHGQSSPLEIIGTINPLARTKFADIDISFKDIEMTKFNPYAAKYLGYNIEKGKLILDLEYLIKGRQLKSENRVRFDNFILGESVDSKDATSLPVSLAISLLKDKDGQINLDLPVSGNLDDPEFRIGATIFKMIGNLILKVAASPFSIIDSMFDGGEELEFLDFKYGDSKISPENFKKIDKLTRFLQAKPFVKLEIQGLYNYNLDAQDLRLQGFQDLIKAEKIKQMLKKGSTATILKDIIVSKEEMPIYIYLAYTKAQFPKPRNAAGGEKQIDVKEKKKLLITNIAVKKDDLKLLSIRRAENIKAYILSKTKIQKERIFILKPIENQKGKKEKNSRVKFVLK